MAYLRKGVVSWKLSCKLLWHFTNLWLTDSFWALPKILHHWPLPWRHLVRPVVPWSGHFGYFVSRHANCQWTVPKKKRSWVPTDLNSCAFSIGIILTSKAKWDFCVNSYSLVSRRIIIFASVRRCERVSQLRWDGSEIATILNEFNQSLERKKNLVCRRLLMSSRKTSQQEIFCLRRAATAKKSDRKACVIMHVQPGRAVRAVE